MSYIYLEKIIMSGKILFSVLFASGWLGTVPCLAGDHFIVGSSADSLGHVVPARLEAVQRHGTVAWDVSLYGIGGSDGRMPFWAVTNRRGLFPQSLGPSALGSRDGGRFTGGGIVTGGADVSYMTRSGIVLDGGLSLAGYGAPGDWNGMVDRMYFGLGWKKLHLDIGMRDREYDFAGLSLTGGDVAYSGNARNLPGYNLHTDYIWLPFRKEVVAFKANFADYGMCDRRFVEHTLVHNESLFIKVRPFRRLDISLGLEMWSQWAGYSPQYGEQPDGFTDYLRVLVGASGGDDALALSISHVTGWKIAHSYLITDISVLLLSLSYIPLGRIIYSLITVTISSNLIDMICGRRKQIPKEEGCGLTDTETE